MRYIEWLVLFALAACGTGLANLIGYGVGFSDSLPGLVILIVISMGAVLLTKILPFKLPIVAYCSILGLISASPISPVREFVIQAVSNINFTAPFTMVGAFAGLAISDQLKTFISQGWKILIVGIFVMTGTFVGSCIWDQLMLTLAGVI